MRPAGVEKPAGALPPRPGPAGTLRVALVGAGRITQYHVAALREVPDVEIVALCDLREEAARARATEFGIAGVFTDAETLMREARPDVVHLLTPPGSHRSLTEVVTRGGAHLYVEKPLASREEDAAAMIEAAVHAGVRLCPGHNRLFDPHFVEAVRRVEEGEIGRVVAVRAEQGFAYERSARSASIPWSYTTDWGIFENLFPHPLYLACHFLKNPGEPQVHGYNLGTIREAGIEELRVLIPSDGASAEVVLSMNAAPMKNAIEIVGTQGRIVADYVSLSVQSQRKSPMPAFVSRFTTNLVTAGQLTGATLGMAFGVATGRIKQYMGLRALIAEFYGALRAGAAPPVLPEHGLINVRLMEKIRRACEGRTKVRVRPSGNSPGHQAGAATPDAAPALAPRVLVTGGSGFLGGRVVRRLLETGVEVRATTRLLSRVNPIPGVEWVECDVTRPEDLRRALKGIETVYHCAALAGPPGTLAEYEAANVGGTIQLAEFSAAAGVRNLIYVSSISVYGPLRGGSYLDENAPYDDRAAERGFYTQTKLAADRATREWAATHPEPRIVIVRPGTLYGPGLKLPVGRFQFPSSRTRPVVAGGGGVPMTLTYVDNAVDAMLLATRSRVPTGRVYNVIDEPDVDQGRVARTLRQVSDGKIRVSFVPYPIVWMAMLAVDLLSWVRRGKMGTARYRLSRTLANMRYPCAAAREELSWAPQVSLEEGIRRVLESEREIAFPH